MYRIAEALVRWLAPVLSFTAEEIWQQLPGQRGDSVLFETSRSASSLTGSAKCAAGRCRPRRAACSPRSRRWGCRPVPITNAWKAPPVSSPSTTALRRHATRCRTTSTAWSTRSTTGPCRSGSASSRASRVGRWRRSTRRRRRRRCCAPSRSRLAAPASSRRWPSSSRCSWAARRSATRRCTTCSRCVARACAWATR